MTHTLNFKEARGLLASILREPYVWPGGYERLIITEDGALLCSKCCRTESSRIMAEIRDGYNTGWYPAGATYEAVSADSCRDINDGELISHCDHCWREFGEMA